MQHFKKLLFASFLFVYSGTLLAQGITKLKQEKLVLLNRKASLEFQYNKAKRENDSVLTLIDQGLKDLRFILNQEVETKDSLHKIIETFGLSNENIEMYKLLKNEKIIDQNSKSYITFSKKLSKKHTIPKEQKFLIFEDFLYLQKFDNSGRIVSVKKIKTNEKQLLKQQKLLATKKLQFLADNNMFLKKITGVDEDYLDLTKKLELLNHKVDSVNLLVEENEAVKQKFTLSSEEKISKLKSEYNQAKASINKIENQITYINEQKRIETIKKYNYSKFKTKNINGIEIYARPLSVREFRNGDKIKKARTEGEWNKFNELKIPAYHFKDFNDKEANYGLIYNYYAITDEREIAPYGFHKLNLIDLNYLDNEVLFSGTKLVDCYCGDGKVSNMVYCTNCMYWTETQKKYNVCSKCQNQTFINIGTKKCPNCNGTKKVKELNMAYRKFSVFPASTYDVEADGNNRYGDDNNLGVLYIDRDGKCKFSSYETKNIGNTFYGETRIKYKDQGFQILICKDRDIKYPDNFQYTKLGDIEIMNTFLNVTKFRNGDPIKYIEDPVEWELALKNNTPAYCYFNNINDGKGCIYNIHAWNDKRGLIPSNWRSINGYDIVNITYAFQKRIKLGSAELPLKPPPGVRNTNGAFEITPTIQGKYEDRIEYYNHLNFGIKSFWPDYNRITYELSTQMGSSEPTQSGFILCVRDASSNSKNNKSSSDEQELSFTPKVDTQDHDEHELDFTPKVDTQDILTIAEEMPSFPGGEMALFKYLGSNINYPKEARDKGIQGIVYARFVVNEDGTISDVEVFRGIGGGCDEETIRVIEAMPNWKPGKQRGNFVKVKYQLPIRFTSR